MLIKVKPFLMSYKALYLTLPSKNMPIKHFNNQYCITYLKSDFNASIYIGKPIDCFDNRCAHWIIQPNRQRVNSFSCCTHLERTVCRAIYMPTIVWMQIEHRASGIEHSESSIHYPAFHINNCNPMKCLSAPAVSVSVWSWLECEWECEWDYLSI